MATKAFKEQKIAHIKESAQKAKVAIVTNYKGLSVEEITNLRRALQKAGADYTVTKNTLAKIAMRRWIRWYRHSFSRSKRNRYCT